MLDHTLRERIGYNAKNRINGASPDWSPDGMRKSDARADACPVTRVKWREIKIERCERGTPGSPSTSALS